MKEEEKREEVREEEKETEVTEVFMTEYNAKKHEEALKKEWIDKGRAEGRAEGTINTLKSLVDQGLITAAQAAKQLGIKERREEMKEEEIREEEQEREERQIPPGVGERYMEVARKIAQKKLKFFRLDPYLDEEERETLLRELYRGSERAAERDAAETLNRILTRITKKEREEIEERLAETYASNAITVARLFKSEYARDLGVKQLISDSTRLDRASIDWLLKVADESDGYKF